MKKSHAFIFLVILLFFPGLELLAEDHSVSFIIAPPPVGYPEIKGGEKTRQIGTNALFLTMDVMDEQVRIFGATGFGNYQESFTDNFSASLSLGGSFLVGDTHDLLILSAPLHMNGILEAVDTDMYSLYLFGGAGGSLSMSRMTVPMPTASPHVTDDTTLTTALISGMISGGAQMNISAKDFVFSPFGVWSYSGGTYYSAQTSSMSYVYPSDSGSVENYSSTVFGFDVLYKPKDISLSSQLRLTSGYTMFSVAVRWLVEGFLPKSRGEADPETQSN